MKIVALALTLERRSNSRSGYNLQQEIQTQITGERVNTLSKIKGGESLRHQATMESEGNLKWRQHVSAMTKRISNQLSLKHSLQL